MGFCNKLKWAIIGIFGFYLGLAIVMYLNELITEALPSQKILMIMYMDFVYMMIMFWMCYATKHCNKIVSILFFGNAAFIGLVIVYMAETEIDLNDRSNWLLIFMTVMFNGLAYKMIYNDYMDRAEEEYYHIPYEPFPYPPYMG